MYRGRFSHNYLLGLILIILGGIIAFLALSDFILRIAIAALGLYLIYHGLRLRGQHQRILFFFHSLSDRWGRF